MHGLIAATSDLKMKAVWGCSGTIIPGADGTVTGTGFEEHRHDSTMGAPSLILPQDSAGYPAWVITQTGFFLQRTNSIHCFRKKIKWRFYFRNILEFNTGG